MKGRQGYSYATPKHLAIADATGDSAVFEIENGKLTIFHGHQYRVLTNPPSYQAQLKNAEKYKNAKQSELPGSWTASDRFVRADYWVRHFPKPHGGNPATAYGFMYSALGNVALPAGLPVPDDAKKGIAKIAANLKDPGKSYGLTTYFQSISDLTNKHYRFKSLIAPSDVFINLAEQDFAKGQPVRVVKSIDQYAERGWGGDVAPHLVSISKTYTTSPSNRA